MKNVEVQKNQFCEKTEIVDRKEEYKGKSYCKSDIVLVTNEMQPSTSHRNKRGSRSVSSKEFCVYDDFSSDYFSSDSEERLKEITTTQAQVHDNSSCTNKKVINENNELIIEKTATYAVVNKKQNNKLK